MQRIPNKVRSAARWARARYWAGYLRRRKPVAYAPYRTQIYRDLLQQLKARPDIALPRFDTPAAALPGDRVSFFLRHDVDTAACVANLERVAEENRAEGVAAAIYVRCDGTDYQAPDAASAVARCRALGFEIGLHSSAYVQPDPLEALRRETGIFLDAFGFAPRTVTIHGLGDFRHAERQAMVGQIAAQLHRFGFAFTDAHESLREYEHVITDCHPDPASGRRFIYADMLRLPPLLRRGRSYLVLTHPCYWS